MKQMSKRYEISREEVEVSWKAVQRADGCPGYDGKTIDQVAEKLEAELYKIWNRMSSGSYQAQAVKIVSIPKAKGGVRKLGIPTVTDRVAQTVIKNRLVKEVDHQFHVDSYAYREGKSAIEAVLKTRERCMKRKEGWIIDLDIKGFFDNMDHDLMLEILKQYTQDSLVLLYSKKFLKAEGISEEDGERIVREKGTPQGGCVSPVLANLYLHEVLDQWMKNKHPDMEFARYADDIIVHCDSESQAYKLLKEIEERLKEYKLELNHEKTRVVYAGIHRDHDYRGHNISRKFTFLGYDFKPRNYKGKIVFTPGIGQGALTMINKKVKQMQLTSLCHRSIDEMAQKVNKSCRGWINYYGHCRRSELYKLAEMLNIRIVKYLKKKHKQRMHGKAWDMMKRLKERRPKLFVHWYMIAANPQRAV